MVFQVTPRMTPSLEVQAPESLPTDPKVEAPQPEVSPTLSADEKRRPCSKLEGERRRRLTSVVGDAITTPYRAVTSTFGHLKQMAVDDKRRMKHAFKVAFALNMTALYIFFTNANDFSGHNGIWAVMTVVVIFEFTAGATYSKGLNRGLGTFLAGVLVLGLSQLAMIGSKTMQQAIICVSIFCVGMVATFLRFIPKVKAKYDYGVLIFLLTFSLLMISTTSNKHPVEVALSRLYMIALGCSVSLITATFVYPMWAGDELHSLVHKNILKLSECLETSVNDYLDPKTEEKAHTAAEEDPIHKKYHSLFVSKSNEDSLCNFATWEPPHGKFLMFKYPWGQYVKVGTAIRHCSYAAMALHGCLSIKAKAPAELRQRFEKEINAVKTEVNKVLTEVGENFLDMKRGRPTEELLVGVNKAANDLRISIEQHSKLFVKFNVSLPSTTSSKPYRLLDDYDSILPHSGPILTRNFYHEEFKVGHSGPLCTLNMESIPSSNNFSLAAFTFLLMETAGRIKHIAEAVDRLAVAASFDDPITGKDHIVIDIQ